MEDKVMDDIPVNLEQFWDAIPDSVYVTDFDGNIIYTNISACQALGYSRDELLGMNLLTFEVPEYTAASDYRVQETISKGEATFITAHYRRDKTILPVEVHARSMYIGEKLCIIGIARQISQSNEVLNQILNERNKLSSFIEAIDCGIVILDPGLNILFQNEHLNKIYGRGLGKKCYTLYEGKKEACFECPVKQCMADGRSHTLGRKSVKPDGEMVYSENIASPVLDSEGKVISVLELIRDVTDQKLAEYENKRLQIQQQAILDNIPDMAWIKDIDHRFIATNEAMEIGSGVAAGGMIGKTDHDFYPQDLADKYIADDTDVMQNGRGKTIEEYFLNAQGKLTWIETIKSPIFNAEGEVIGISGIARDITQRKLMEEKLRKSEESFRLLAENAKDLIYRLRLQPRMQFEYISASVTAITGYTPEEYYTDPDLAEKVMHADDKRILSELQKHLHDHLPVSMRWRHKDGRIVWVEQINNPVWDNSGNLVAVEGIARDVTDRKLTEEALRESERRFREFAELLPVVAFEADLRGKITFVSNYVSNLLGYAREELLNQPVFSFIAPEDRERSISNSSKVLAGQYMGNNEYLVLKKDGNRIATLIQTSPLKDSQGNLTGIRGVLVDIEKLKQVKEALILSEEKYRSLVENVNVGIFRTTIEGRNLECNQAISSITGYPREEMLDIVVASLYTNPEDRKIFINQVLSSSGQTNFETRFTRKDKSQIDVVISAKAIRDEQGRVLYLDGFLYDVTAQKRLEARITDLYKKEKSQRLELEEEARVRGLFIDVLAHELRTPLTPILVSTGMLRDLQKAAPDSIQTKLTGNIYGSAQTLARRLEELLDVARYSRGAFKLNLQSTNLSSFIREAVTRFQPTLDQRHQHLAMEIEDNLPVAWVDPSRLEQVIINLLSNASKFSPDKGNVSFKAYICDQKFRVDVKDDGIGISEDEQKRIFQPYHRVEQDRQKFPGLGLGLTVSRQIVESHGGKIDVSSQLGQGSTFSFWIPVKTQAEI